MNAVFITAMLLVANVMGASMAYPQAARLLRTKNTEGLSGVWAGVSVTMNIWWFTYGVTNRLWGLIPVSVAAAVLYALIAVGLVRIVGRPALTQLAIGGLVLGMVPLPFLLAGGWHLAGLAIGVCYGMQLVPAVIATWRTRDLAGVAAATWIMAWIESAIWLAYGASVADNALLVGGASGTVMAALILVRLAVTGHRPFRIRRPALALG